MEAGPRGVDYDDAKISGDSHCAYIKAERATTLTYSTLEGCGAYKSICQYLLRFTSQWFSFPLHDERALTYPLDIRTFNVYHGGPKSLSFLPKAARTLHALAYVPATSLRTPWD